MSKSAKAHNPNPSPVVYDLEGHTLEGHASTQVDPEDTLTARLIDSARLLVYPTARSKSPSNLPAPEQGDPAEPNADSSTTGDGPKEGK